MLPQASHFIEFAGTVTKIGNVSITELAVSDLRAVEGFATSVSFKDTPDNCFSLTVHIRKLF